MALVLTQQVETKIPIEVSGVTPDQLVGRSLQEIERLPVWHGNQSLPLAELFHVAGNLADDQVLVWDGELTSVHGIGTQMRAGKIEIKANAGRRVGSQMAGGELCAEGNVSDFAGCEMTGGTLRILGDAGDLVGGHLPGSKLGMNRGEIFVAGDVGKACGKKMRRGTIVIGGDAGSLVGWNMLAGTILVFGNAGPQVGVEMKRGTIVLSQLNYTGFLPTFKPGLVQPVPMLAMLANWIRSKPFSCQAGRLTEPHQMFHGDMLYGGRGEIFVRSE